MVLIWPLECMWLLHCVSCGCPTIAGPFSYPHLTNSLSTSRPNDAPPRTSDTYTPTHLRSGDAFLLHSTTHGTTSPRISRIPKFTKDSHAILLRGGDVLPFPRDPVSVGTCSSTSAQETVFLVLVILRYQVSGLALWISDLWFGVGRLSRLRAYTRPKVQVAGSELLALCAVLDVCRALRATHLKFMILPLEWVERCSVKRLLRCAAVSRGTMECAGAIAASVLLSSYCSRWSRRC